MQQRERWRSEERDGGKRWIEEKGKKREGWMA